MKKILLILIVLVALGAFVASVFIRSGGGTVLKKAAEETYELGEKIEEVKEDMIDKETEAKKTINKKIKDIKEKIAD